ncbi:hypothetical protein KVR01_008007 [Diaporthe batatas]|uniref:uncharacterized protein n=1 Tax=Diaporthe batatas TaxID=748121 RepID=UPI001D042CDF|nr:uncharacterized protein KVR01_008007 [Diaporthe batatas]KAG8162242.1 hypothetical protein KVR01_008007 [Diaporthe batatas]
MLASRPYSVSASRSARYPISQARTPPLWRGLSPRSRFFWIDAICVDQSNTLERNAQVAIFADLFRAAQSVTVWLGPEDQFTDDALAAVEAISPLMALSAADTTRESRRAWDDISYTDFFDEGWAMSLTASGWVSSHCSAGPGSRGPGSYRNSRSRDRLWSSVGNAWYNALKQFPDPEDEAGDLEQSGSTFGSVSLDRLMSVHRDKLATDPRDKVYAFIGLADTKTEVCGSPASSIRPDYELPVQDVYTRVMAQLLLANRDLHLLSHVQDPSLTKLEGLPSWVPDFSVMLAPYPLRFRGAVSWSACGDTRWQPPPSDEDMKRGILHVQGSNIGVVEETALLKDEVECSAEYWSSIVNLALSLDEQYPDLPNWTTDWRKPKPAPHSRLEAFT